MPLHAASGARAGRGWASRWHHLPTLTRTSTEAGERVSCLVNTDGHPRDVERRMREVARRLRDLAAFLEDAAETGFAEGDFRPAVRGPDAVQ